jgi:hypothetical protein
MPSGPYNKVIHTSIFIEVDARHTLLVRRTNDFLVAVLLVCHASKRGDLGTNAVIGASINYKKLDLGMILC